MKGATLYTTIPALFPQLATAAQHLYGSHCSGPGRGINVITEDGKLFLLNPEFHGIDDPLEDTDLGLKHVLKQAGYLGSHTIECRWEELFCDILNSLARVTPKCWVICDTDGRLHLPGQIDPEEIGL